MSSEFAEHFTKYDEICGTGNGTWLEITSNEQARVVSGLLQYDFASLFIRMAGVDTTLGHDHPRQHPGTRWFALVDDTSRPVDAHVALAAIDGEAELHVGRWPVRNEVYGFVTGYEGGNPYPTYGGDIQTLVWNASLFPVTPNWNGERLPDGIMKEPFSANRIEPGSWS